MTPQQQAQEYDFGDIEKMFLAETDTSICNYPSYEAGYHKGHAAGIQAERERHLSNIRGLIAITNRFEGVRVIDRLREIEKELKVATEMDAAAAKVMEDLK